MNRMSNSIGRLGAYVLLKLAAHPQHLHEKVRYFMDKDIQKALFTDNQTSKNREALSTHP